MIPGVRAMQGSILRRVINIQVSRRFVATAAESVQKNTEDFSLAKPLEQIPGPSFYRFLKDNIQDPTMAQKQDVVWKEQHEEFGEIVKVWLPIVGYLIFIKNPEEVQKLLIKDGKFPIEPGFDTFVTYRNVMRKDLFPETAGLLGHHGEKWWEFRSQVQQDMMRPKSAFFYINILEDISSELIQILSNKRDDNQEVDDILKYAHRWGLESIGAIFLDARLGCLDENQPEDSDGKRMIQASSVLMGQDALKMMQMPLWRYYPFAFYKRYDEAATTMYNISKTHIEVAMKKIKQEEGMRMDEETSVLAKLMRRCGTQSQIPLVMAMDAMFAGIDTTGNTETMFLYNLAVNPTKQEILYQEIISLLGHDGNITESKLNKMKYLKASLRESMRLFSSIAGLNRRTQVDMVLSGYLIPKGTWVVHLFNNNHMDPTQFPEPDQFLPERWLRDCPVHQKAHPFANLPFAHGPRMCIGRRFAELEMMILTVKMLQKFRLEYHHQPIGWETNFTVKPNKDVRLKLIERK